MSVFNIFGYAVLGFEQPWLWPFIALLIGYTAEILFELISAWAYRRRPRFLGGGLRGMYKFLLPSHITALAVNMLLYANNQILADHLRGVRRRRPASTCSRRRSTGGCGTS